MKLLTYDAGNGPRAGVLVDDRVVDAANLLGTDQPLRDVQALLELSDAPLERLHARLSSASSGVPLAGLRVRPPVLRPPTVRDFFAFEQHVAAGARNRGLTINPTWYRLPVFYFSNPLCMYGPEDEVPYPSASQALDYELEIAAVIGKEGTDVAAADGMQYIAGFTILNDWSARDVQFDEGAIGLGPAKGKDFGSSIGPVIVTTDELAPYIKNGRMGIDVTCKVNGELWSQANGEGMHYSWADFVERASHDSRIAPGDVFGSGTVGTGCLFELIGSKVPGRRWLEPGDVVEMEAQGIGVLRNRVGPKRHDDANYRYKPEGVKVPMPEGR